MLSVFVHSSTAIVDKKADVVVKVIPIAFHRNER
jgi:hypothetical protein